MLMAFLENFGKKVGEAAQAAAKKSGDLVETTKINVNINSEEDKIQKLYNQIGKLVYTKYASAGIADEESIEACEAIKVHEQNIKGLKDKLLEIKGTKQCTSCGNEMDKAQLFCSKCGARNDLTPEPEAASSDGIKFIAVCPACGAALQQGSQFCMNCGSKIG
jgi:predicted nucleic acid-binding Zn ribbon protein